MNRIGEKEKEYVSEVLKGCFKSSETYKMVARLEEAFSKKMNVKYSIAMANGTATLHTALEAAGVGIGDEVIVPPLTMASTAFGVLHSNAVPVFADVDPDTFTISPGSIENMITPKTKAIITVALYGLSPDMDPIIKVASKKGIVVIEDNAQCFLGKYKGKMTGSLGNIASYSFQGSKHMTCGEGGMIITDDKELAIKSRRYSCLGYAAVGDKKGKITKTDIQDPNYNRHLSLGWNYRMSDICAAVALGQLERLDELVEIRQKSSVLYGEAIKGCNWLVPQKVPVDYVHTYWTYTLKLDNPKITWSEFRNKYNEFGGDGIYAAWKPTYLEPAFINMDFMGREKYIFQHGAYNYRKGLCPIAEDLQPKLLQFKTNYWDMDVANEKINALKRTINYFEKI
jgi:perosamine synthetase